MRAEMTCFAVISEVFCACAHFSVAVWTGSGSAMDAPLSTAKKKSALQRRSCPHIEPLRRGGFSGEHHGRCSAARTLEVCDKQSCQKGHGLQG